MLRIAVLCLLLTGCGAVRVNHGAARSVSFTSAAHLAQMHRDGGGIVHNADNIHGLYSRRTGDIWLRRDDSKTVAAAVAMHELGHALEKTYGQGVWDIIDQYDAPGFPCRRDTLDASTHTSGR